MRGSLVSSQTSQLRATCSIHWPELEKTMLPHRNRKFLYWKEENVEILSIYAFWV